MGEIDIELKKKRKKEIYKKLNNYLYCHWCNNFRIG
jgi:hypothetical protein